MAQARWRAWSWLLVLWMGLPLSAVAQPDDPRAQLLAVQKAMQSAIEQAEPAIACVLVSRSDRYTQLAPRFAPANASIPGQLGNFDSRPFLNGPDEKLARRLDLSDPDTVPDAYGSGVVLASTGLILTNYHVIQDATKIFVRLPGRIGSYADIHAADPRSDLAVLKLQRNLGPLKTLPLGDGAAVRKGDWVISLANPFAVGFRDGSPSASWGIISNLRRRAPGSLREEQRTRSLHHYGTLIQTDARLNLGVSGGALISLQGELIGLTTSLAAVVGGETAGGFAIPMDRNLKRIVQVLLDGREVEYGFLGIAVGPPGPPSPSVGIEVRSVTPGSPAAIAGIRPGDTLTGIDGQPVREPDDLFLHVGSALAGNEVVLSLVSQLGNARRVTTRLAKFYLNQGSIASQRPPAVFGLRVDYSSVMLDAVRLTEVPRGVLVREIEPGSPAEQKLKKLQDNVGRLLITEVNGVPIINPSEFLRESAKKPQQITLSVVDANRPDDPPQTIRLP
ncbi:trypsin-like peptidase domain-containing protein [Tuwongella immobilis]|uniref:PDZ domain-containing protein n=1 Tax=Tuwongella immobilis TaxID=692036 RepID=A0A6C2YU77_9BACT|nr:trypsin-like peptidase domain-containing protein [Tuwongella immobilis]VIP04465.1 pdz dhr glgf domain-containing protein : Trypsin-like serine protease with C-terminal PDZ domain OS=Singulisphaera acidiphila (strain ATCC BAA-1392 / DSM 18658 / VKM B-2454 / MOB10) GN=Sinac_5148 PE=4 SV=1: Trypsin_2: PDZ_2 [Tuwongella immobilis]VTS06292.1 pdz dhr glgf domain-containing protein : Trypsin-like serine protease with C-terminal PDZ domain OS=Singulisphaera acidiphila (strain ATCC BAA-1392 / DSM 18658